jgi:hypothetical protein
MAGRLGVIGASQPSTTTTTTTSGRLGRIGQSAADLEKSRQYTAKHRSDGGFDFFNKDGQKTTIEDYAKNTGTDVNTIRSATAGSSKQDAEIVTKAQFENDPAVQEFNKMDVSKQRQKIADLQGLAGRTKFTTPADVTNAKWAQDQLDKIEGFGKKAGGNPLTFLQDTVGQTNEYFFRTFEGNAAGIDAVTTKSTEKLQKTQLAAYNGMTKLKADIAAKYEQGPVTGDIHSRMTPQDLKAYNAIDEKQKLLEAEMSARTKSKTDIVDPTKYAGAVAQVVLDAATADMGGKVAGMGGEVAGMGGEVAGQIAKPIIKGAIVKTVAKDVIEGAGLGAGYGAAQTAQSAGKDATASDYLTASGTGAITGALLAGLGPIGKVVYKKAAETLSKKLGRDLTPKEATDLVAKTKSTVNEPVETPVATTPRLDPTIHVGPDALPTEVPIESRVPSTERVGKIDAVPTIKSEISPELKTVPNLDTNIKIVKAADLQLGTDTKGTNIDPVQVEKYKAQIQKGEPIDPIIVTKDSEGKLFVQDGQHRLEAARQLGITDIPTIEKLPKTAPPETVVGKALGDMPGAKAWAPAIPEKPIGDTVSGNARRIEQNAIEKKLTAKFNDLPEYKSIDMKDQAKQALDLVTNDRQKAIDIIEGKANPEGNLKAQSVHQALEEIATKEGDVSLLEKLAKSHINTELSESAQRLRIAAERDPHSAVEAIRQVKESRVKMAEKRARTTIAKETENIRKGVKAKTPVASKQDWASFIQELQC